MLRSGSWHSSELTAGGGGWVVWLRSWTWERQGESCKSRAALNKIALCDHLTVAQGEVMQMGINLVGICKLAVVELAAIRWQLTDGG